MTKSAIFAVLAAAAVLAAGCGKGEKKTVEPEYRPQEPVILIDGDSVTLQEFQQELGRQLGQPNPTMTEEQKRVYIMQKTDATVNNLVMRKLFEHEMDRSGVLITQADVEEAKATLEKSLNGKTLTMLIAEVNLPMEALEENLKLDIFKNKVLSNQYAAAWASVTEESVEEFYRGHPDYFRIPEGRDAGLILVAVPADAGEEAHVAARTKLENVKAALKEGADFEGLARETSDDPSKLNGGKVGILRRGAVPDAVADALFALEEGQTSDVVEIPQGYALLKALGTKEAERTQELTDEVKNDILLRLKKAAQDQVIHDYIQGLRSRATIQLVGPLAPFNNPANAEGAMAE